MTQNLDIMKENCDHFLCCVWADGTCANCGKPVNITIQALRAKEYCERMIREQNTNTQESQS